MPAGIGAIGGMVGMLIVFGVAHIPADPAVVFYQAVGVLVPLSAAIAYLFLRRRLGPLTAAEAAAPPAK